MPEVDHLSQMDKMLAVTTATPSMGTAPETLTAIVMAMPTTPMVSIMPTVQVTTMVMVTAMTTAMAMVMEMMMPMAIEPIMESPTIIKILVISASTRIRSTLFA